MFKGVEHRLEFTELLEKTAELARSEPAKKRILKTRFSPERDEVIRSVLLTDEMVKLIREVNFPLEAFPPLEPVMDKLKVEGSVLTPEDLLKVRAVCLQSSTVLKFLKGFKERFERVFELSKGLSPFSELIEEIDRTVDETGYILDSASEELLRIRGEIRGVSRRIKERIDALISRNEDMFPGRVITKRNGRYVVLVKPNFSQRFRGLVHDRSSSGHTLYVEPETIVDENNRLITLKAEEKREVERVLKRISSTVSSKSDRLKRAYRTLIEIDRLLAVATMSLKLKGTVPEISDSIDLKGARHPLLELSGKDVTPVDITFERGLVITGPNTGGKTVTLKTLGLLVLMFQSGYLIPADEGSRIRIFRKVMADIGDEQSIEQNLSTFSSHARNISAMLKEADEDSLILLDELGAGTDPVEGSNLGIGILEFLKEKGAKVVATTHFTPIKLYAYRDSYYTVASVMFDEETLEPLYRLAYGVIGKSYALVIAKRFGMPDEVIEYAEALMSSEERMASRIISLLEEEHRKLLQERERVSSLKRELERKAEELKRKEKELKEKGIREIRELLSFLREEGRKALKSRKELHSVIETGRRKLEEIELKGASKVEKGQFVRVSGSGKVGKVLSVDGSSAKVQVGNLIMKVKISHLEPVEKPIKVEEVKRVVSIKRPSSFFPELNVIGMRGDEALSAVEKFLDSARIEGFERVKIIHGHGMGILKRLIREYLKSSPYVKSFSKGSVEEGGDAVTVVQLR